MPDPLKYRLLSGEETAPFIQAHHSGDQNALPVLKDKFAEEGDPREDILNRHLELTSAPTGDFNMGHIDELLGGNLNALDIQNTPNQDFYTFTPVTDGGSGPRKAVHIAWSNEYPTGTTTEFINKRGYFTPEEARIIADKFPEQHAAKIHEMLDKHFGKRVVNYARSYNSAVKETL